MMAYKDGITGLNLIIIIAVIMLVGFVILLVFERYISVGSNRTLIRIIVIGFMLNIAILIFLIFSYNKIMFTPGVPGPKGISGRPGPHGNSTGINGCAKPIRNIEYMRKQKKNNKFVKPVIID